MFTVKSLKFSKFPSKSLQPFFHLPPHRSSAPTPLRDPPPTGYPAPPFGMPPSLPSTSWAHSSPLLAPHELATPCRPALPWFLLWRGRPPREATPCPCSAPPPTRRVAHKVPVATPPPLAGSPHALHRATQARLCATPRRPPRFHFLFVDFAPRRVYLPQEPPPELIRSSSRL